MANDGLQGEEIPPLILKKKIKIPAEAHGGAWKVAYADFVTAMMAFFLLLWLLNATTEDQMTGLSRYFAPPSAGAEDAGIGEILAGMTAAVEGAMRSASSVPTTSIAIPSYGSEEDGLETGEQRDSPQDTEANTGEATVEEQEQELLDDALSKLKQSIRDDPLVRDLQESILFALTEDGLMIQLLDFKRREMFEPGGDQLTRRAQRLLALISSITLELPNQIAITGHTDSAPQPGATAVYTNWELSGDRAARSREWMVANGFPEARIIRVEGKADSALLNIRDPLDERNRRISILLLRDHKPEFKPAPVILGSSDTDGAGVPSSGGIPGVSNSPARDASGLAPPPLPDN